MPPNVMNNPWVYCVYEIDLFERGIMKVETNRMLGRARRFVTAMTEHLTMSRYALESKVLSDLYIMSKIRECEIFGLAIGLIFCGPPDNGTKLGRKTKHEERFLITICGTSSITPDVSNMNSSWGDLLTGFRFHWRPYVAPERARPVDWQNVLRGKGLNTCELCRSLVKNSQSHCV